MGLGVEVFGCGCGWDGVWMGLGVVGMGCGWVGVWMGLGVHGIGREWDRACMGSGVNWMGREWDTVWMWMVWGVDGVWMGRAGVGRGSGRGKRYVCGVQPAAVCWGGEVGHLPQLPVHRSRPRPEQQEGLVVQHNLLAGDHHHLVGGLHRKGSSGTVSSEE